VEATEERGRFWDATYRTRGPAGVSWYQPSPTVSLELVEALAVSPEAAVIDVGGGTSLLADALLERGFTDVTILDVSAAALDEVDRRLGGARIALLCEDVLRWTPSRTYDLWHDRAAFHFLVTEDERQRYLDRLRRAVGTGGHVILGTFAPDAPERCSGLPVVRYSPAELERLLGERFELLATRREEHTTPRGAIQPFTWVAGRLRAPRA
jgi:SAM-dependent methyltransferase